MKSLSLMKKVSRLDREFGLTAMTMTCRVLQTTLRAGAAIPLENDLIEVRIVRRPGQGNMVLESEGDLGLVLFLRQGKLQYRFRLGFARCRLTS